MAIIQLSGHCKPSSLMKVMRKHAGSMSQGDQANLIATRTIAGRKIHFFRTGEHRIEGDQITEQEAYDSEVLRFAHASLITGTPVGDKALCYVDATRDPCDVWVFGMELDEFIKQSKAAILDGRCTIAIDEALETNPLQRLKDFYYVRDVRLS